MSARLHRPKEFDPLTWRLITFASWIFHFALLALALTGLASSLKSLALGR